LFKQKVRKTKKREEVNVTGEFKLKERSKKTGCVLNSYAVARVRGRAQAGANVTVEFKLKERSKKKDAY